MKNLILIFLIVFSLFSCQNDSISDIDENSIDPETILVDIDGESIKLNGANVSTANGEPLFVGYGYSPLQKRPFRSPIDSFEMIDASSSINNSSEITVDVLRSVEDFERYFRSVKRDSFGINFNIPDYGLFNFGVSRSSTIVDSLVIDKDHVSVAVTIKLKAFRHVVSGLPFLDERALTILNTNGVGVFLKKYGPSYVSDRTSGAYATYIYNYTLEGLSEAQKEDRSRTISIGLGSFFGLSGSRELTQEEMKTMNETVINQRVLVSLPGFVPSLIAHGIDDTPEQLNEKVQQEVNNMINYINVNPDKATAIETTLSPYSSTFDLDPTIAPEFIDEYEKEINCYMNYEEWLAVRERVSLVYFNTENDFMRTNARQALEVIDGHIQQAQECNGASERPNDNVFDEITL